jgi:hypothetical protein
MDLLCVGARVAGPYSLYTNEGPAAQHIPKMFLRHRTIHFKGKKRENVTMTMSLNTSWSKFQKKKMNALSSSILYDYGSVRNWIRNLDRTWPVWGHFSSLRETHESNIKFLRTACKKYFKCRQNKMGIQHAHGAVSLKDVVLQKKSQVLTFGYLFILRFMLFWGNLLL